MNPLTFIHAFMPVENISCAYALSEKNHKILLLFLEKFVNLKKKCPLPGWDKHGVKKINDQQRVAALSLSGYRFLSHHLEIFIGYVLGDDGVFTLPRRMC